MTMSSILLPHNTLRLAFYDASDGPRLMIFGSMDADFSFLLDVVRQLSVENKHVKVDTMPFISPIRGIQLTAISHGRPFDPRMNGPQGVKRTSTGDPPAFEWRKTCDGWDYIGCLIESLISSADPCHHYLSQYPSEDAIIVLSKGEYSDSVLK